MKIKLVAVPHVWSHSWYLALDISTEAPILAGSPPPFISFLNPPVFVESLQQVENDICNEKPCLPSAERVEKKNCA